MNMVGIFKNKYFLGLTAFLFIITAMRVYAMVGSIYLPPPSEKAYADYEKHPIIQAVKNKSIPLPLQTISNLLKAASQANSENQTLFPIQIYVIMPAGAYIYHADENVLIQISEANWTDDTQALFTVLYVGSSQTQVSDILFAGETIGDSFAQAASSMGLMAFHPLDVNRMYLKKELKLGTQTIFCLIQSIGALE